MGALGLPPGWKQGYRENGLGSADVFFHSVAKSLITERTWLHEAESIDEAWSIHRAEQKLCRMLEGTQ